MKVLRIVALVSCIFALAAIAICLCTDWNDEMFLYLALVLSAAGNLLNLLCNRDKNGEGKNAK